MSRLQNDARWSEGPEGQMHKGHRGGFLWCLSKAGTDGGQVRKQVQEGLSRRFSDHNGTSKKPEDEASEETQPEVELPLRNQKPETQLPLDVDHHRFKDAEQT